MERKILVLILLGMLIPIAFAQLEQRDIIVVRGDILVDYIPALAYASHAKIPVIFIQPEKIQADVARALSFYAHYGKNLLIIGGEKAISEDVEEELRKLGFYVSRLWDWDRYGTAARIAIDLWKSSETAVIAEAENSENLLLAEYIALKTDSPVLFTKREKLPEVTKKALTRLGVEKVYIVGNVSENVITEIKSLTSEVEIITGEGYKKIIGENYESHYSTTLVIFILSILAIVIAISFFVFMKRRKTISYIILDTDEEKIVELLKIHGTLTQKRIAELSGFSKPKTSRILKSLFEKGVIERIKHKKTQKIKLKQK